MTREQQLESIRFMEVTGYEVSDSTTIRMIHDGDEHKETFDIVPNNAYEATVLARRAGWRFANKKYGDDLPKHIHKFRCLAMSQKEIELIRAAVDR